MKKIVFSISIFLCCAIFICACTPAVSFRTEGAQYEVIGIETGQELLEHTAGSGNTLLAIVLSVSDSNLDDAQASFFPVAGDPCSVTVNGQQYPCLSLIFRSDSTTAKQAVLLFEVPADLSGEFTLAGDTFSAVSLKK